MQKRHLLCRKRVPLAKRIRRYYDTVGLTALHGQEVFVENCPAVFYQFCNFSFLSSFLPVFYGELERRKFVKIWQ